MRKAVAAMRAANGGFPAKILVKVRCDWEIGGQIVPLMFRAEDGPIVKIDRILDVRKAASTKAGGCGIRYTCRVRGKELYLFRDDEEWFVVNRLM